MIRQMIFTTTQRSQTWFKALYHRAYGPSPTSSARVLGASLCCLDEATNLRVPRCGRHDIDRTLSLRPACVRGSRSTVTHSSYPSLAAPPPRTLHFFGLRSHPVRQRPRSRTWKSLSSRHVKKMQPRDSHSVQPSCILVGPIQCGCRARAA